MEKRTEGAWLINHTKKLHDIKDTYEFEDIELAGKCGVFLSNLAASDEQSDLNADIVNAIAKDVMDADDEYLDKCMFATCPKCDTRINKGVLIVGKDGVFNFN